MKPLIFPCALLMAAMFALAADTPPALPAQPVEFIDTSFENASPLWYEFAADGTVTINLIYDQERLSPNRAAGHFHFRIQAEKGRKLGSGFVPVREVLGAAIDRLDLLHAAQGQLTGISTG